MSVKEIENSIRALISEKVKAAVSFESGNGVVPDEIEEQTFADPAEHFSNKAKLESVVTHAQAKVLDQVREMQIIGATSGMVEAGVDHLMASPEKASVTVSANFGNQSIAFNVKRTDEVSTGKDTPKRTAIGYASGSIKTPFGAAFKRARARSEEYAKEIGLKAE